MHVSCSRQLLVPYVQTCIGTLLVACILPQHCWAEAHTIESIISGMQSFKDRIDNQPSWLIEYTHDRDHKNLPPGDVALIKKTSLVNARKGEWLFVFHDIKGETESTTSKMWCAWRDNVCVHRSGSLYLILPDPHPGALDRFYYTNDLFLNLHLLNKINTNGLIKMLGALSLYDAFPFALPATLEKNKNAFNIRPNTEDVDGSDCVVLENPGKDVMWIDTDHGFVCRRRILYQPSGEIGAKYSNEGLKQYSDGFWLPSYQKTIRYNADNSPKKLHGTIRYIEHNRLKKVQFGEVADSVFTVPKPKKGTVSDQIRGVTYQIHERGSDSEKILNEAASQAAAKAKISTMKSSGLGKKSVLIAINCAVIALLLLAWQRRRHNA